MKDEINFFEIPPSKKSFGGFFIGEKVVFLAEFEKFVFLCADFVTASKLKKGLQEFGKKVEIISCGRENDDEKDENLFSFAKSVNEFLDDKIDGLIFLPSSLATKFDLNFLKQKETFSVGQEIELEKLCQTLTNFGFERTGYVSAPGQFAVRGDVVDIFWGDHPIRVEFFDEEIEKIVKFDFQDMKTLEKMQNFTISPIFLKDGNQTILDLCENIFVDEPSKIENECAMLGERTKNSLKFEKIDLSKCYVFSNTQDVEFENQTIGQKSYITDFMSLKTDITNFVKSGIDVFLFAGKFKTILKEFLQTNSISFSEEKGLLQRKKQKDEVYPHKSDALAQDSANLTFEQKIEKLTPKVHLLEDYFPYSFSFLTQNVIAIGTDDMYKSSPSSFRSNRQNFAYLPKVNDFVVHSFYGIGRCKDIVRMKLSSFEKDYFVIEYKNGGLLYVPTEQANLLSAYIGGVDPKLNALGSSEFSRLKEKVKANLKELAIGLAKIYKERETQKGFAFVRDEALEKEFAENFEFELTPDQAQAVLDVDADMESDKIMDRLICGDVGFGKTEVAFRAIFKACYNGKQVAFLCPTTILSEQHFRNCKERMKNFGLRVEVLNRFKSAKETEEIYSLVAAGKIDILIGTHKILNENLHFKDLGLLVLDEEQRFGVKDKEKIKKFKSDVDVLTLSATPIPRTLHMSLSGIRDISVIATAPRDRLPIQTYVTAFSETLLKDVVQRELSRNGKTLILFNRVAEIYQFCALTKSLLPNANIAVAHGQMEEHELARVISDLYNNKFNVLISTTLIENGIDLPQLNTLFVVDCDMLGLGQLYQIRGRIGRGDKLAYAYLTYDGSRILTEEAYKRLEAIKEFRELGSGFKIAMRDLEIRGAGNILGKEQHGHMQKVGYDMYVKLLEEVTKEAAGQSVAGEKEIQMELSLSAFISENYITSVDERIVFYDKISKISTKQQFESVKNEMQALGGQLPIEVENLCKIAFLKNLAANFNVKKICINSEECYAQFYKSEQIIDKRLSNVVGFFDACLKFEDCVILKLNSKGKTSTRLDTLIEIFSQALKENL